MGLLRFSGSPRVWQDLAREAAPPHCWPPGQTSWWSQKDLESVTVLGTVGAGCQNQQPFFPEKYSQPVIWRVKWWSKMQMYTLSSSDRAWCWTWRLVSGWSRTVDLASCVSYKPRPTYRSSRSGPDWLCFLVLLSRILWLQRRETTRLHSFLTGSPPCGVTSILDLHLLNRMLFIVFTISHPLAHPGL